MRRLVLRAIDAAGVQRIHVVGKGRCPAPAIVDGFQRGCLVTVRTDNDEGSKAASRLNANANFDAWLRALTGSVSVHRFRAMRPTRGR
jgi:hypothetical protein